MNSTHVNWNYASVKLPRRTFLCVVVGSLSGCINLGMGSAGSICVGFGCGGSDSSSERREGREENKSRLLAKMVFKNKVRFSRSIRPEVDNIVAKYRLNTSDSEVDGMVRRFFVPSRYILGQYFLFEPTLNYKIFPELSKVVYEVEHLGLIQSEIDSSVTERLLKIIDNGNDIVVKLRWSVKVDGAVSLADDSTAIFETNVRLTLDPTFSLGESKGKIRSDKLKILAKELNTRLRDDYRDFISSNYGITVQAI